MGAGKIIGGILSSIAGLFICIVVFMNMDALGIGGAFLASWIINLFIGVIILIGGLAGFGTRKTGAVVIVCAIISIILGVIGAAFIDVAVLFGQYSLFQGYMSVGPWQGITLEAIFAAIGGLFIAASSDT
ncbi:unnamed protein product [marine sediment metagenome]|uniref:Uncharacterized protein n=1 Tax=marine sediment metagenome TaxID=412755 RepID=X1BZ07_9ZZZZ